MDKVFQKFLRSGIDLSPVGVERREDNNPYFCTPKGASIFGWAGVDGIHFCFVRGFGGKITPITINLDRKAGQPVRLSLHLVPKLQ